MRQDPDKPPREHRPGALDRIVRAESAEASIRYLIEPAELATWMTRGDVTVIDTRSPAEFAAGHIPTAVNLPEMFTYDARSGIDGEAELRATCELLVRRAGLSPRRIAVVYEDSMTGGLGRSCRGMLLLRHAGHADAFVLHGGLRAWRAAGGGLSTGACEVARTRYQGIDDPADIFVGSEVVVRALETGDAALVDVRDADEWEGVVSAPSGTRPGARTGRLPGALWLPWRRLLQEGPIPRFRDVTETLAICAECGLSRERSVLLYCYKGARASNTFVALKRAGFASVRVYLGSWLDWSADPLLPIDGRRLSAAR